MNAYMNISVRVLSANAQAQIKALQAQVAGLQRQLAAANATSASPVGVAGPRYRKSLVALGSQAQWTGRQLQANLTLPILLAGAAATKFALDNEKAFTRVKKVYGDTQAAAEHFNKEAGRSKDAPEGFAQANKIFTSELNALSEAFEALSSRYGVAQKEVLETAGAWAAAGVSGRALAESTELSIKAAILGDMELAKATEALISVQAQYSLTTGELSLALAELNAIENQTAISMSGLIEGFTRSAGVAREAGIDVRHLGAMLAALVPATGSAATAGNALKTIISRLMSPTKDSADVMREFGVDVSNAAWQSSTAVERLDILAQHMGDSLKKSADGGYVLSDSQKQVVASVLGSRYQMNRFLVLMREMDSEQGNYQKALDATVDNTKVFRQAHKELEAVLKSNPQRLKIMWTTLQNGMADAIQPMIPYLIYLAQSIAKVVQGFNNLDPAVQKIILITLVFMALIGPLIRYVASLLVLFGAILKPISFVTKGLLGLAVVTKVVDGVLITTRRSFIAMFLTMLAFPFKAFLSGMALLIAGLFNLGVFLVAKFPAILATVAKIIPAIWRGMFLVMQAIQAAFWLATYGLWATAVMGLPKLLLVMRRGVTAAWALIIAAMRTGAIKAALVAAGPWIALGAIIVGAIWMLRRQIVQIWNNIVAYFSDSSNAVVRLVISAWNALPQGVANALIAVANIVKTIALQIYEWFSYINPFARHSPSLVENVTEGMKVVGDQFGAAASVIGAHVRGAYSDIKSFGKAVRELLKGAASFEEAEQRTKIKKFAPGALDEFNKLASRLRQLKTDLEGLQGRLDKQQAVVDRWTNKVEAANRALDAQQDKLDALIKVQDKWQDLLSEAEGRLDKFASAPLVGMGAMSDAIFENEMAQKQLRLEMMRMEEVTGPLDDIKSKIEAINGAQEMLRGEQAALRSAGAGSEILSHYDDEIAALEATKNAQTEAAGALQDMSDALDELQRKGEMLDLENSLQFDPLTRAIEQAANAMQELPFDEVMAGVTAAAADIAIYQDKLDAATAAVDAQQAVVDRLTEARDLLQASLDREQEKLDAIKKVYDEVSEAIRGVEQAMNDAASASERMSEAAKKGKKGGGYVSPAVQNFRDAAGGNFADVGGDGIPIRTDWSDQTKQIEDFTKSIADEASKAFSSINPFDYIKKKWGQFEGWLMGKMEPVKSALGDMFSNVFSGVASSEDITKAIDSIKVAWTGVSDWFKSNVFGPLVKVWALFWPSIKEFFVNAWEGIKDMFRPITKEASGLVKEIGKMGPAFKGLWNILKPVLGIVGGVIAILVKLVLNVLAKVIRPVLAVIGEVIGGLIRIVKGALQIISGFFMLFTKDWKEGLGKMVSGVVNILGGLWDMIASVFKNGFKIVFGIIWGIIDGVIDAFKWLLDVLVGHSIIPDMIDMIVDSFMDLAKIVIWLWNTFINPIVAAVKWLLNIVVAQLAFWWTAITAAWSVLATIASWFWDNVLKPIWDIIVSLWNNFVQPHLAGWWEGIKLAWNGLLAAGAWLWDNVLGPAWAKVKYLWAIVRLNFAAWWAGVKLAWNGLRSAGKWLWDNVLSPVWNRVKDSWVNVRTSLSGWWDGIKGAWSTLTGLGKWFYDNVMKPVYNRVTGVWNDISDWLTRNKGLLTSPMKGIVNVVIDAVNAIIKGLNKVADILPGIDWDISTITRLERGGPVPTRRVGSGFKTNGARAIVGEGKANWPEYVIPTDPTHRQRATALLLSAASKIGLFPGGDPSDAKRLASSPTQYYDGLPAYGIGGILGDAWGAVSSVGSKLLDEIKKLGKYAIGKIMNPLLDTGAVIVNGIKWEPPKAPPLYGIDKVRTWVKNNDEDLTKYVEEAQRSGKYKDALSWARGQAGKPYKWGAVGPDGYDCSGFMSAITNVIGGKGPNSRVGTTANFPWSGFKSGVDSKGFTIGSAKSYAGGVGHMAGTLAGVNVESRGGYGVLVGGSARGWSDPGFNTSAHYAMKQGGIALANRGPVRALIGDGRYDEAVVPLPKGWRTGLIGSSGGDKHYHFYGELSFPNIRSGDDAEILINNLEALAED